MGASGTGIFDDDVARDIRTQYAGLLTDGKSAKQARLEMMRDWQPALADEEDGPVIWLALAAAQIRFGCLEPLVKKKALAIIDDGSDLERWRAANDPERLRGRVAALKRLRANIESYEGPAANKPKMPKPAKPKRKRFMESKAFWPLGEVIAYRLRSGEYILLHTCDYFGSARVGFAPIFAILDWRGKRIPPPEQIQKLPLKVQDHEIDGLRIFLIAVGRSRENELPTKRVVRPGVIRKPHQKQIRGGFYVCPWIDLDKPLEDHLGWK